MSKWVLIAVGACCVLGCLFVGPLRRNRLAEAQADVTAPAELQQQADELRAFAYGRFLDRVPPPLAHYADEYADAMRDAALALPGGTLSEDQIVAIRHAVTQDAASLVEAGASDVCARARIAEAPLKLAHIAATLAASKRDRGRVTAQIDELGAFLETYVTVLRDKAEQAAVQQGQVTDLSEQTASNVRTEYERGARESRDDPADLAYKVALSDSQIAAIKAEVERIGGHTLEPFIVRGTRVGDAQSGFEQYARTARAVLEGTVRGATAGPTYPPAVRQLRESCCDGQIVWLRARDELPRTQTTALLMEQWLLVRRQLASRDEDDRRESEDVP